MALDEAADRHTPRGECHREGRDERQDGEDPSVRDPVAPERAVLDERGSRERPSGDGERRHAGDHDPDGVRRPLVRQQEPEREHGERSDDAGPRSLTGMAVRFTAFETDSRDHFAEGIGGMRMLH